MTIHRHENTRAISEILPEDRLSNQVVFTGSTGNTLSIPNGIFFLELLVPETGNVITIETGDGLVITGVEEFSQDHSPLRCDRGVTFTGDLSIAKGFVVEDFFV